MRHGASLMTQLFRLPNVQDKTSTAAVDPRHLKVEVAE